MNVISVQDAAIKWGISARRIQKLCEEGRVMEVRRMGRMWLIPSDAEKPFDMRIRHESEK